MKEIQESIYRLIAERDQIWQQHDRAMSNKKDLTQRFSNHSKRSEQAQPIPALTPHQLPPAEVEICLERLEEIEGKIKYEQSTIEENKNEIAALKIKARNLIIGLSVGGIFLLLILVIAIRNQLNNSDSSKLNLINAQTIALKSYK